MPESYAIDTSALISLESLRVSDDKREGIWRRLFALIEAERIFTVEYVFPELEKNSPSCAERLKAHARLPFRVPVASLMNSGNDGILRALANNYPQMVGVGAPGNKADGWLITLARERGLVVVTQEGTGSKQKIPAACVAFDIECINTLEFVVRENLAS
jgi:hypothetical protein